MQMDQGGIVGPEGPGWPCVPSHLWLVTPAHPGRRVVCRRLDHGAPSRGGTTFLPASVREQFLDEHAEPSADGTLWPQPTQCLMEEGDVTITMHAIPHSGTGTRVLTPG